MPMTATRDNPETRRAGRRGRSSIGARLRHTDRSSNPGANCQATRSSSRWSAN